MHRSQKTPRDVLLNPALSTVSAHNIFQLHLPFPSASSPKRGSLSWALPCSTHVAVSLMKLVLQHLPVQAIMHQGQHSSTKGLQEHACY